MYSYLNASHREPTRPKSPYAVRRNCPDFLLKFAAFNGRLPPPHPSIMARAVVPGRPHLPVLASPLTPGPPSADDEGGKVVAVRDSAPRHSLSCSPFRRLHFAGCNHNGPTFLDRHAAGFNRRAFLGRHFERHAFSKEHQRLPVPS